MKVCLKKQAVLAVYLPEGADTTDFKEVCDALAAYGCWDARIGLSSMRRSCDLVVWRPADGIPTQELRAPEEPDAQRWFFDIAGQLPL